jgi:heme-degrading monooxygenase HmoA
MRDLAINRYGCLDFISLSNSEEELAISYWPDEAAIQAWKKDPEHSEAQSQGRAYWYSAYTVEVVEVKRRYSFEAS